MDEKKLTIEQVETIMEWSYPTALKFATNHGEMAAGKWYVPARIVEEKIIALVQTARFARARYEIALLNNGQS